MYVVAFKHQVYCRRAESLDEDEEFDTDGFLVASFMYWAYCIETLGLYPLEIYLGDIDVQFYPSYGLFYVRSQNML